MLDLTFLNNVTREHFVPGLRNQLYDEMPIMKAIRSQGVEDAVGRSLINDVVLARNVANGQVAGYGYVVTQEGNLVTQAALNWADFYYATISISLTELKKNSGGMSKEKLVDMLTTKMDAGKMTLKENVYAHVHDDETSIGGLNTLVGLKAICGTSNSYAGIDRSLTANAGWRSNLNSNAISDANLKDPTAGASYLPTVMRTLWLAAAHDKQPEIIPTTTRLYEIYEYIAETQNLRFGGDVANLSFGKASLSGQDSKGRKQTAEIYWDKYCTAKHMYFLTLSDFQLFIFPGCDFEAVSEFGDEIWQRGQNQLAWYMNIVWAGQLLCKVPRHQALASALGDA